MAMANAQDVARQVLATNGEEVERISANLASLITRLKQVDLDAWRREGQDLVDWMNKEAAAMARVERDVAITKATGGGAAIAGGVMTTAGIVASFFTFGLAAPLAVAGMAIGSAGAATSAGGDIAKLSILHEKTSQIKNRCETFGHETEAILNNLLEIRKSLSSLLNLCQQAGSSMNATPSVVPIVLRSCQNARMFAERGAEVYKLAKIVRDIGSMQKSGVIFGKDYLKLTAGTVTGSSLSISKALWKGSGTALGIGFGIWDVVDAAGTLKNGGSHSALIRSNASQIRNLILEIDSALRELNL